jgi:hypothetical protein
MQMLHTQIKLCTPKNMLVDYQLYTIDLTTSKRSEHGLTKKSRRNVARCRRILSHNMYFTDFWLYL